MALRKPNTDYRKIAEFLEAIGRRPFTSREVANATRVRHSVVSTFLVRNFRRGFLSRTRTSLDSEYTYVTLKIPRIQVSKGEISNLVWNILNSAKAPVVQKDLVTRANLHGSYSWNSVHNVALRLHARGILERTARGYVLKKHINQRPSLTANQS